MKHILALILALLLAGNCEAYSMGYFPKDDPPAVPVPVPDPVPTPTVTTEQGTRSISGNEVDFYFSKPITSYGKFDLRTGGKKYTIKGSYKDGNIEVRNSQTKGNMVVIAGPAYKGATATVIYPSTDAPTVPDATPPPVTPPADEATTSKRFAHINHMSWRGQGTTIVFCAGDDVTSVTFHDTAFHFHMKDGLDKGPGREQWTNHYFRGKSETGTAGMFVWTIGGKKYQYYSDGRGDGLTDYQKHTGDCYQKYK